MAPSYRILLSSVDAVGHVNCTLGFGELLKERGHEIIFANRVKYEPLAIKRGFEFIAFDESLYDEELDQHMIRWIGKISDKFSIPARERYRNWSQEEKEIFAAGAIGWEVADKALSQVLSKVKVDLIVGDFAARFPCLYNADTPFIPLCSLNPLIIYPQGPPLFSGYSVNVDKKTADEYWKDWDDAMSLFEGRIRNWLAQYNVPAPSAPWVFDEPKYFGFYHYAGAVDYEECGPRRPNWVRIDAAIRQADGDKFVIPSVLADKPGRLIYFSLGSIGSSDLELMRRLIAILAKSPHRFIVSKGSRGDELELADNMWGENYVNQIEVLQVVDLVITHGGNNTFLESIYFGRPLIVIPFFFDQIDNAQRVVDKKLGQKFDSWDLDEKKILQSIEETLADEEIKLKIKKISDSMKSSNTRQKAVEMVEELIAKTKKV